jgi:RNA polymerase sigma factor (sigma-70 family)
VVFKRKPEGTALDHHTEYRTAYMLTWKYRKPLFARGLDRDDIRGEIVVLLYEQKHRYDPARGASYVTWCYMLTTHYITEKMRKAEVNNRRMRLWRPQPQVYHPSRSLDRKETLALLWKANLSRRERDWLFMWCNGGTLRSIAAQVGVSAERVRQIITKATKKMRLHAMRVAVKHRIPFDELWGTI